MSDLAVRWRRGRVLLAAVMVSVALTVVLVTAGRPPASGAPSPSWTAFAVGQRSGAVYPIAVSSSPTSIGSPGAVGAPIGVRDAAAIAITPDAGTVYLLTKPLEQACCAVG